MFADDKDVPRNFKRSAVPRPSKHYAKTVIKNPTKKSSSISLCGNESNNVTPKQKHKPLKSPTISLFGSNKVSPRDTVKKNPVTKSPSISLFGSGFNTATPKQKQSPQKIPTISLFGDNKTAPKDTNPKAVSKSRTFSLFLPNNSISKSSTTEKRVARVKSVPTKSLNKGEISPTQSFLDGLSSYGN